jgi:hypothetical protein
MYGDDADRLLAIVRALLTETDFRRNDTEHTLRKIKLLSAAASYLAIRSVDVFGGRAGPS